MTVALKRAFLIGIMVLALLASLIGWTGRMMSSSAHPHHGTGIRNSSTVAYTCPPPPYACW